MKNIAKDKSVNELKEILEQKKKALVDFSSEVFQGKTKNVKSGRNIRKEIAQILTALRMEQLKNK